MPDSTACFSHCARPVDEMGARKYFRVQSKQDIITMKSLAESTKRRTVKPGSLIWIHKQAVLKDTMTECIQSCAFRPEVHHVAFFFHQLSCKVF